MATDHGAAKAPPDYPLPCETLTFGLDSYCQHIYIEDFK